MKNFILILILLIGINWTAHSQLYLTGKVDLGKTTYLCLTYPEASLLVNAGIKSLELEEKNKILLNINDSLEQSLKIINNKIIILEDNITLFKEKEEEYNIIIENQQQKNYLLLKRNNNYKKKEKLLIILLIITGTIVIIK